MLCEDVFVVGGFVALFWHGTNRLNAMQNTAEQIITIRQSWSNRFIKRVGLTILPEISQ